MVKYYSVNTGEWGSYEIWEWSPSEEENFEGKNYMLAEVSQGKIWLISKDLETVKVDMRSLASISHVEKVTISGDYLVCAAIDNNGEVKLITYHIPDRKLQIYEGRFASYIYARNILLEVGKEKMAVVILGADHNAYYAIIDIATLDDSAEPVPFPEKPLEYGPVFYFTDDVFVSVGNEHQTNDLYSVEEQNKYLGQINYNAYIEVGDGIISSYDCMENTVTFYHYDELEA